MIHFADVERAHGEGIQSEYSEDVTLQFDEWLLKTRRNGPQLQMDDIDALIFPELTDVDKERVREFIKEYSE